jgi:hypothetical protein
MAAAVRFISHTTTAAQIASASLRSWTERSIAVHVEVFSTN